MAREDPGAIRQAPERDACITATSMFVGITGTTDIGRGIDPESLQEVLRRAFTLVRTIVSTHGGSVERFIGDAAFAVFGVPEPHVDDALRAVHAALEIRAATEALNTERHHNRDLRLRVRIGINTGEVTVAGGASGDPVNVASRLEHAAPAGEIFIGGTTYHLVRDSVTASEADPLVVQGRPVPLRVHRLIGLAAPSPAA